MSPGHQDIPFHEAAGGATETGLDILVAFLVFVYLGTHFKNSAGVAESQNVLFCIRVSGVRFQVSAFRGSRFKGSEVYSPLAAPKATQVQGFNSLNSAFPLPNS